MTRPQITALLEPWFTRFLTLEEAFEAFEKLSPVPDLESSPLWAGYYNLFDAYTDQIADRLGPEAGPWLAWFLWDNDAGLKQLSASPSSQHRRRPIKTLRDLVWLIHGALSARS